MRSEAKLTVGILTGAMLGVLVGSCVHDSTAQAADISDKGNQTIESFSKAKRLLETQVYNDHRVTFYCLAPFDRKKNITLPEGFRTPKHEKRALRVEWEHVVPAENFGRAFVAWREGDPDCRDNSGREFKGRKCAEKVSQTFRLMQADLYNLVPAIGAVNAMRSNYRYTQFSSTTPYTFGTCPMKVDAKQRAVEPPDYTRGAIARTMLYMADAYSEYRLSSAQQKLAVAWDTQYPVSDWECKRAYRIERIQGNANPFVKTSCLQAGLYKDEEHEGWLRR